MITLAPHMLIGTTRSYLLTFLQVSVFEAGWPAAATPAGADAAALTAERLEWEALRSLRDLVNKGIEQARSA